MKTYKFLSLNNLKGGSLECKLKNMCRIVQHEFNVPHMFTDDQIFSQLNRLCKILTKTVSSMLNEKKHIDLLTNIRISLYDPNDYKKTESVTEPEPEPEPEPLTHYLQIYSLNIILGKFTENTTPSLKFNSRIEYPSPQDTNNKSFEIFPFQSCLIENTDKSQTRAKYIVDPNVIQRLKSIDKLKTEFDTYCATHYDTQIQSISKYPYVNLNLFYVIYKLINLVKENYMLSVYNTRFNFMTGLHINYLLYDTIDKMKQYSTSTSTGASAVKQLIFPIDKLFILFNILSTIPITHLTKKNNVFILNKSIYFLCTSSYILLQIGYIIFKITPTEESSKSKRYFNLTIIYKNEYALFFTRKPYDEKSYEIKLFQPVEQMSYNIILNEKSNDNILLINKTINTVTHTFTQDESDTLMQIDLCMYYYFDTISTSYYENKCPEALKTIFTNFFSSASNSVIHVNPGPITVEY